MPNDPVRIILDTNLWISFLIKKDYSRLDSLLFSRQVILVFSEELLEEFITVVKRQKFRKYFSLTDLEHVINAIEAYAEFIKVKTDVTVCRDEKDNFLLSLAIDGGAFYLISGDYDLLELKVFGKTNIVTFTDLLKKV